ncbi:hypothetical protein E0Z10_g8410 [Xylaria hypoxylon]|uniref:C2H2-type domain-containing protein n=1 Tax=Xylaria hypoxylon TaxID=37992 RepID=A0A4Z0Y867_9PEZI|nr:hypothetical protein E0Z10_g8410 [Xylaria hypoxylon]
MDPEIKRSVSPTSTAGSWTVSRYLTDNKSPLLLYPTMDPATSGIVSPFPPAHFQRAGSPSYTNSSSTCSSVFSPPRETDYCQGRSPPTPSDVPLLSPYDSWRSHPQVYEFTGLADGCVNLGDVNPMQDFPIPFYEDNAHRLHFSARTSSMSSEDSNVSHIKVWNEEEVPQHLRSSSLDTPIVKEEICIPDNTPNPHTLEEDDIELGDDPESPYLKTEPNEDEEDDEDDDDEYNPCQKSKNTPTKSARNTKSHKRRSTSHSSSDAKRPKTTMEETLVVRSGTKAPLQGAKGQYSCPDCLKVSFKDRIGLDNHIKKQHTRPFTCIFEFAGCRSTFASKNEWKRHCASQHIVLQYWVCQQDACAQVSNKLATPKKSSSTGRSRRTDYPRYPVAYPSALPNGTIFNRKDLYTQHLRRMHVPAHLKTKVKSKTHVPEWDDEQRRHQDEAIRTRCQLPMHMLCPAPECNVRFDGVNAWDERMEHVAKHLEKAAAGIEPPVPFGGDTDSTLVEWATSPAIGILRRGDKGRWALQNPLKATGYPISPVAADDEDDEDADAEGEEVDE